MERRLAAEVFLLACVGLLVGLSHQPRGMLVRGSSARRPSVPEVKDQGLSRLTLQPGDQKLGTRSLDPDDDGTRGDTSIGRLVKQLRQGLFGVLFVMAKDAPESSPHLQALLSVIDFIQVKRRRPARPPPTPPPAASVRYLFV